MLSFLDNYLTGTISTKEFKDTFDRKTRKDWDVFGLKGLSGGMFLNMIVNHISDELILTNALQTALMLPKNVEEGRQHMRAFIHFLENIISSHQATKKELQPARVPFFLSAWWHLQATEEWPIFYPVVRQKLALDGLYISSQDPIKDYFTFRECYLSLAPALHLKSWELEHVFAWLYEKKAATDDMEIGSIKIEHPQLPISQALRVNNGSPKDSSSSVDIAHSFKEDEQTLSDHIYIQWLLATIGHKLGCNIWIATNDQNRIWSGERLGDLSLKSLPPLR